MIGVVGGMGPYAGLDLVGKVFAHTSAVRDQDHLPVALLSLPDEIPDRTAFLLGEEAENPASAIGRILRQLGDLGATVAGIACNTAHSPRIFDVVQASLTERRSRLRLLSMVEETVRFSHRCLPRGCRIGILSTSGSHRAGTYREAFRDTSFRVVALTDAEMTDLVHRSIYHPGWGIKAHVNPVSVQATERLTEACRRLVCRGAQAVILGCTELSFALPEPRARGLIAVDPAVALARALIRSVRPDRLMPLSAGHASGHDVPVPRSATPFPRL
ncbi:MAG: amino acid racemase [Nannocystaceae bacterium]